MKGKGSFRRERKARAGVPLEFLSRLKLEGRPGPRVSLALKTSFPYPFKHLPRTLKVEQRAATPNNTQQGLQRKRLMDDHCNF